MQQLQKNQDQLQKNQDIEPGERFFTTNEVAEMTGYKPGTISYYVNQGQIAPTKNELGTVFTMEAIRAFMSTRQGRSVVGNWATPVVEAPLVEAPKVQEKETSTPLKGTLTSLMETIQEYLLLNQMDDVGCSMREIVDPGIRIWEIDFPDESLCAMKIGSKTFIIKGNYLQWIEKEIEIVNMG